MTRKQYVDPFASDDEDGVPEESSGKNSAVTAKSPDAEQSAEDTYEVVTKRYSNTPVCTKYDEG